MNITRNIIISSIAAAIALSACDDSTSTIGSSLVTDRSEIIIDSTFTITGSTTVNNDLPSRTTTQILGSLDAKEYGRFSSEFVTQFMPALKIDTTGVSINDIDSIRMYLFYLKGDFTGDSIVPMGLKVYPLTKQLPSEIYSNFDPDGYYDESNCWTPKSQIYTGNALHNDSIGNLAYRSVIVNLPLSFGKKFYQEYLDNPATFATPQAFAQFFPGIYVKNSFGSGRVINFNETRVVLYYRQHAKVTKDNVTRDTVYNIASAYMAVTPEIISNNIINLELSSELKQMASNADEPIIVAPAGYDVELTMPIPEIIHRYRTQGGEMSVINSLAISIPAKEIANKYNILPPKNVLLVLSKDKDDFYANNKITDDLTSFLATYDDVNQCYTFLNMRQYLLDMLAKDELKPEDYTFTLTPVNVTTESTSSSYYQQGTTFITAITPYVAGPAMCKIDLKNAKIKFTYSKQIVNN